jgi:hypothetical protein
MFKFLIAGFAVLLLVSPARADDASACLALAERLSQPAPQLERSTSLSLFYRVTVGGTGEPEPLPGLVPNQADMKLMAEGVQRVCRGEHRDRSFRFMSRWLLQTDDLEGALTAAKAAGDGEAQAAILLATGDETRALALAEGRTDLSRPELLASLYFLLAEQYGGVRPKRLAAQVDAAPHWIAAAEAPTQPFTRIDAGAALASIGSALSHNERFEESRPLLERSVTLLEEEQQRADVNPVFRNRAVKLLRGAYAASAYTAARTKDRSRLVETARAFLSLQEEPSFVRSDGGYAFGVGWPRLLPDIATALVGANEPELAAKFETLARENANRMDY